ncbi:MAG: hypothetical protein RL410_1237 [Actinomycetota bacterium]
MVRHKTCAGSLNFGLGSCTVDPGRAFDALAWFKILVNLKEMLNFEAVELGYMVNVAQVFFARVMGRDAQQLVVATGFVGHAEHADSAAPHDAARKSGFIEQHHGIEWVAIETEGAIDKAVIPRVAGGGEEHAIQTNLTSDVINLVLVAASARDLDDYIKKHLLHGRILSRVSTTFYQRPRMEGKMAVTSASHLVRSAVHTFLSMRVEAGDVLLVGVSGGADSLALAAACASLSDELSVTFVPVIVDHQLQQGSHEVAENAAQQCKSFGLERCIVTAVTVVDSGEGLEAAARKARYEAFHHAIAETGAVAILLAHSLEDQAETVLMRLSRGSGTRSISAMAQEQGIVWRPLLTTKRAVLRESLNELDIAAYDDPHNFDDKFLRVKVRTKLMPMLRETLGDTVDEALARTASMAREDADALDHFAELELHARLDGGELDINNFAQLPKAISTRCVRMWLLLCGVGQLSFEHINAVWRLATDPRVQGPVKVAGGVEVSKASGRLRA